MNVKIGTEAAEFPEKEYINGFAIALCRKARRDPGNLNRRTITLAIERLTPDQEDVSSNFR
jgi:hypothetical protein